MGTVAYIDYTDSGNDAAIALIETDADRGTHASQTFTLVTQPTAGDTVTIGANVYTWQANGSLTNVAGNVEIGANLAASQTNIRNAVNHTGTPGTGYAAATSAHPTVTLGAFAANVATVTAILGGTAGNAIATTETFTAVGNVFGGATLAGGTTVPMAVVYRIPANFSAPDADPLETAYVLDANTAILAAVAAVGQTARSIDDLS